MIDFSWQNWIRITQQLLSRNSARKSRRSNLPNIEGLEDRALLTANLPVAVDDPGYVANEDQQLDGTTVLANDTDADGDTINGAILGADVQHGTLDLNQDGTFTYTPDAGFSGTDSFTYFARDSPNNENSATAATVTITVNAVNDVPVATPQTINATEDTPFNGQLAGTDEEGSSLTFSAGSTAPAHGQVTINPDGTFTYTPTGNYNGPDSFSFKVNDGNSNSTDATVTVSVAAVNDAPTADNGTLNATEDTPANGTLTGSDVEGSSLSFSAGGVAPAHGQVTINPNGTYTYTPASNYNGQDSFSFVVNDGSAGSAEATITVTVAAVNDAPVATPQTINATEDTPFNGSLAGTDVEGSPLTFSAGSSAPAHGNVTINSDGTFTYTPTGNYSGPDSFTFKVNDGTVNSADATVTITVAAANDAPTASNGTLTTAEDTPGNGTLTGSDIEGSALTFAAGSVSPAHGQVTINPNGTYTYTPASNYNGPDSFSFVSNDGTTISAEATITVTVTAINDAPVAAAASYTFAEDTVFGGLLGATDAEGSPLTFAPGTVATAHGTVTISANGFFVYTPAANFHGTDSFSFLANDGALNSNDATVTLTVTPVNDAPAANAASITTDINTAFNGTLTGTDVDGNTLTFAAATQPAHGTVTVNSNGTYTYTPTNGYVGADSFTFRVNDGTVNSADATISITVSPLNSAPTVVNGSSTVNENAVLNDTVTPLATDTDGDPLTFTVVTPPAHGTLTLSPDGTFVYTPATNYSGPDSFTFKANDGTADSNVGTVNITVVSVDSPLILTLPNGTTQVSRNSTKVPIDAGATVSDIDTTINWNNSQVTVTMPGISSADASNGRIRLSVRNQGTGSGLVKVKGSKIYYNGSSTAVASFTGGTGGRPLVITFTSAATEAAVNAVLKQISVQASKKASVGTYAVNFSVTAGAQTAQASKSVVIS